MTAPAIPAGAADLADRLAVWRTIINGKLPGLTAVKPADTSRNTTTTYASDPDLVLPLLANTSYRYVLHCGLTAAATPQFKSQFTAPASTIMRGGIYFYAGTTNASVGTSPTGGHAVTGLTGTDFYWMQTGLLVVGATAGNLSWQWAQTVSNGTNVTAHRGSCLILERLN